MGNGGNNGFKYLSRRKVFDCRDVEPTHADLALDYICALYPLEAQIREKGLMGHAKHVGIVQSFLQREARQVITDDLDSDSHYRHNFILH